MADEPSKTAEDLSFLVVEDNAFTEIVIRKTLASLGVGRIESAADGEAALERLDAMGSPPDLVLLDLRLPGMGGVEFLTRLSDRRYPGRVIITSGVDAETLAAVEEHARGKDVRILGVLPKPLNASALADLLSKNPA